ncbi:MULTISPECIES: ferredoxin [unclassified Allobranchiibius]|uniref:ferredoxin n=1 Tax=unclassified Allobranchiibius TaxID=2649857 RepID=UPI001AA15764|nr:MULTISPECIES: ferredoxin [unclassified Allobranchiibius]MBO1768353.1 ferredoxin [Allobranchiibius sp. GilTou38]UIJ35499.1 ferredoxin [Allobranchiibius sp. GilTou73]
MRRDKRGEDQIVVDRVACTAHGVCAVVSGGAVELDEFGYPVPSRLTLSRAEARVLVEQCPARALLLARDR